MSYYEDHFAQRNVQFYEIDGILNIDIWDHSKSKILFILKETAGYKKSKFYLNDEIPKWIKDKVPTYVKIAQLSLLLEKSIAQNSIYNIDELRTMKYSDDELLHYIQYSSIININKESVHKKSNDNLLYKKYEDNIPLLKWQINEIRPKIVVAGSTICWNCISYTTNGLYGDYNIKEIKKHEAIKSKNIVFYHANHPSAWTQVGFDPIKIYQKIIETFNNK